MSNTKTAKRRRRWKQLLGAGCLALGMATTWGGEARAEIVLTVTAAPTVTINNAYVFFANNSTTAELRSLGTLPGGQTTVVSQTFGKPGDHYYEWTDPAEYQELDGHRPPYVLIGLYGPAEAPGVAISFPSMPTESWSEIFETAGSDFWHYPESQVIAALQGASSGVFEDQRTVHRFLRNFATNPELIDPPPLATDLGQPSVIALFSDPTLGGTVTVDVTAPPDPAAVPEPATWVLLVGLAGVALVGRRKLLGG